MPNLDRHFTLFVLAGRRSTGGLPNPACRGGAHTKIERLLIPGPAGKLESLFEWDPESSPRLAALVCHPHPLHGGTLHNKVVFRAAKAALQSGLPTLRFNFRGAGLSQGKFDEGIGEGDDVRAGLDYLETRIPQKPVCLIGFSFGAWVGLAVGAVDSRVRALAGLGLPTASLDFDFLRAVSKPKLIIQGTEDQFGARAEVQALFASLAEPKRLHWVDGVDHFFAGKLEEVQTVLHEFLQEISAAL